MLGPRSLHRLRCLRLCSRSLVLAPGESGVAPCIFSFAFSGVSMQFVSLDPTQSDELAQESSNGARPATASASSSRPGTSSGRRKLTSAGSNSNFGPELSYSSTNDAIIHRELGNDELLRILNRNGIQRQNDLFVLAESGDYLAFKRLVDDLRTDLGTFRGLHGYTLLHHSTSRGHGAIVAELVRNNADLVNVANDLSETPLHLAAYAGHLLIVDQLLDSGAGVNAQNSDQETPLFYAARRKHAAVIRLLLQRGALADLTDRYGDKAVDHADAATKRAFSDFLCTLPPSPTDHEPRIHHDSLLHIFSFLQTNDLLRAACVSRKWHMVSSHDSLWKSRGLRRWELALQSSLGFAPTASTSFLRSRPGSRAPSRSNSLRSMSGRSNAIAGKDASKMGASET